MKIRYNGKIWEGSQDGQNWLPVLNHEIIQCERHRAKVVDGKWQGDVFTGDYVWPGNWEVVKSGDLLTDNNTCWYDQCEFPKCRCSFTKSFIILSLPEPVKPETKITVMGQGYHIKKTFYDVPESKTKTAEELPAIKMYEIWKTECPDIPFSDAVVRVGIKYSDQQLAAFKEALKKEIDDLFRNGDYFRLRNQMLNKVKELIDQL